MGADSESGAPRGRRLRARALAPPQHEAFEAFSKAVFEEGRLPEQTRQLIAVACAHVTQCPHCIAHHARAAAAAGATPEDIMEAVWVAAEMRAGAAVAHARHALKALEDTGTES